MNCRCHSKMVSRDIANTACGICFVCGIISGIAASIMVVLISQRLL